MTQPHIIGIRHHSPACARLVEQRIRGLQPAYVLIEGPADFNDRLDELALPHRLPIAIYSYVSSDTAHYGSWSPLAEHSPEWQALRAGRELGAQVRFIDLPVWHGALAQQENRYADVQDAAHERHAAVYEQALADALSVQGHDALWDHLFEDEEGDMEAFARRLRLYFSHLRPVDEPGSANNQAREHMMAHWIAWAVAQADGQAERVLVVCGGWHAPALARLWQQMPASLPATPLPENAAADTAALHYGSYLVPYSFKRLDAFSGYASGMPSPAWYQWVWELGQQGAAARALQYLVQRLRKKKQPASTADLLAVHVRAQGLARLRGHRQPLRCDWLDALAGSLVKTALDVPVPWSYRGPLLPGTAPELVEAMDVLAGQVSGQLAPGTPQPPLVASVHAELAALGIRLQGTLHLQLHKPGARAKSRVLHRLQLLDIPGIVRHSGPHHPLSGDADEHWQLSAPLEQTAALIEAAAWGASLVDAARAQLEHRLHQAQGRIQPLTEVLCQAAWAGLGQVSQRLLHELHAAIACEPRFEALAPALGWLHTLLRHGDMLDMQGAPLLCVVLEAGFDRALWLLEPPATIVPADMDQHLAGHVALRHITADALASANMAISPLPIEPARALAVWQRKAADSHAAPVSRGAALGAVLHFAEHADADEALALLHSLPVAALGDALTGLLALARERLGCEATFIAGLDQLVQALDNADFVQALPAMRAAFAWLPPQERGTLAEQVLTLHQAGQLSQRVLTQAVSPTTSAEDWARMYAVETTALAGLQVWGIGDALDGSELDPAQR